MVFLNIKKLESQLVTGRVTSNDEINYFIGWLILISLASALHLDSPYSNDIFDIADFLVTLTISIVSLRYLFKVHNRETSQFFTSLISLAFVIFWRLLLFIFVFYLVGKIILYIIPLNYFLIIDEILKENTTILLYTIVFELLANFLLIQSFRRINNSTVALQFK